VDGWGGGGNSCVHVGIVLYVVTLLIASLMWYSDGV
jgi:hypothetical protein